MGNIIITVSNMYRFGLLFTVDVDACVLVRVRGLHFAHVHAHAHRNTKRSAMSIIISWRLMPTRYAKTIYHSPPSRALERIATADLLVYLVVCGDHC